MAKSSKKKAATADDALSAVEDALKIDFESAEMDDSNSPIDVESVDDYERKLSDAAAQLNEENGLPELAPADRNAEEASGLIAPLAAAPAMAPAQPANDRTRSQASRFAYNMQKKPSASSYLLALVFSAVWIAAGFYAGFQLFGEQVLDPKNWLNILQSPNFIYLAASIVIPLLFIWAFAIMTRRAQELRLAARSMTEAAYRLIEPETVGEESIRSVGQAIQLEVQAMNTGIEQALSRAGELESIVHGEISSLEIPIMTTKPECVVWLKNWPMNARPLFPTPNGYALQFPAPMKP